MAYNTYLTDEVFGQHRGTTGPDDNVQLCLEEPPCGAARTQRILDQLDDEDVDAKAERVEELGGLMVESPQEIPGGANICLFNEPSSVIFAMLQRAPQS